MREHKYRVWHNGAMYAVYNMQFNGDGSYRVEMIDEQEPHSYYRATVNTCDLIEYTGLNEINNVDIYESDIVRIEHTALLIPSNTIGVVSYVNGRYVVDTHAHTHGLNVFVDRRYRRYAKPVIEVVGNVYEHPELAPKK